MFFFFLFFFLGQVKAAIYFLKREIYVMHYELTAKERTGGSVLYARHVDDNQFGQ